MSEIKEKKIGSELYIYQIKRFSCANVSVVNIIIIE